MRRLEIFFDYACPYCLRAHELLLELLPRYSDIEADWRPCESHPRPDRYGPHSDLCIRGMYFARGYGADLLEYHRLMYRAALIERADIEDPAVVARAAGSLLDAGALERALRSGRYEHELKEANAYAFNRSGVWVVPAYRMDGRRLDARENIGVTRGELAAFLAG
ncbi:MULTISPECIES: DsbA family oxidoreductase [Anaerotruncus]|jgi:predicted DsbA family dithiol-disulfide isomerase|uniref:DsbA family protein n=1 Tax=Anaerotruncus colihominis TaxID=169435 RepID=A0A845T060_9FIRM|nr:MULTISPECIES: DsbA family protein [Anaerotruncus]MCI8492476.1 DsbA family protein [Anaerotruncus sp.]MCR2025004.1 DsbA family protein [Anaerotruncus colihominis]NBI77983.1 hypothetical protein [Anaerotruncus colihominis]NDO40150.1 DsbA family protein [Anaerotruncus colihominis]